MKTLKLTSILFLFSLLSFALDVSYSISYKVNDSLTTFNAATPLEFSKQLLLFRDLVNSDFVNNRILESDFLRINAKIESELNSLELTTKETIKSIETAKRVKTTPAPIKAIKSTKKPLNIPLQQLAQTKDILNVSYYVAYGSLEYETTNQTEYINTLQDAIEFLYSDFENALISENDFNRINNKFTNELNKYNLL